MRAEPARELVAARESGAAREPARASDTLARVRSRNAVRSITTRCAEPGVTQYDCGVRRPALALVVVVITSCTHASPAAVALASESGEVARRFDDNLDIQPSESLSPDNPESIACVCMAWSPHKFVALTPATAALAEGRVDDRGRVLNVVERAASPDTVATVRRALDADFRERCMAAASDSGGTDGTLIVVHGRGADAKPFSCGVIHVVGERSDPADVPLLDVCRALFATTQRTCP
jgi:hypothetical protein